MTFSRRWAGSWLKSGMSLAKVITKMAELESEFCRLRLYRGPTSLLEQLIEEVPDSAEEARTGRGSFGSVEKMSRTLSVGLASSYRVLSERDRQPLGGTLALLSHRRLAVAMLK